MESSFSEFAKDCLKEHNYYRSLHNSPPLVLDEKLNDFALEWATELVTKNIFEHRKNNPYGESLYVAFSADSKWKLKAAATVQSWYDEIKLYKFGESTPENLTAVERFTQLVWTSTRKLGVGLAFSEKGNTYVVCNYEPAGNIFGEFELNVSLPKDPFKIKKIKRERGQDHRESRKKRQFYN